MAVDERSRRLLFQRLEEVLGVDDATTLMAHLPPSGWQDVATKSDVEALARELRLEMTALRHELVATIHAEVSQALTAQTRMVIFTMAGTIALLGGLVVGILGLQ